MVGIARPLCATPDAVADLLAGRSDQLPRPEKELRIGPGWLGPNSPIKMVKAMNGFAAQAWYYQQLRRIAAGKPAEPGLNPFSAFLAEQREDKCAPATDSGIRAAHHGAPCCEWLSRRCFFYAPRHHQVQRTTVVRALSRKTRATLDCTPYLLTKAHGATRTILLLHGGPIWTVCNVRSARSLVGQAVPCPRREAPLLWFARPVAVGPSVVADFPQRRPN